MSWQRAKKFCELCHKYSNELEGVSRNKYRDRAPLMFARDFATSQAMMALETDKTKDNNYGLALTGCYEHCEYKEPLIKMFFNNKDTFMKRIKLE